MAEAPVFFLPMAIPDRVEAAYADMASWCHCAVPDLGKRIYSISFEHDREAWTATVGQTMRGRNNGTTVQAIFAGTPFTVFTNSGANRRSVWGNPFYVGKPTSITYFSVALEPPEERK